ncbi:MAG: N-6 DNA methylase [Gemmatimonadota bacterium]
MNFIINETAEKLRGGYYTDSALTEYLLRWVRASEPESLLEPSCGDGAFFRSLINQVPIRSLTHILGCELDCDEANKAAQVVQQIRGVNAEIRTGDFLTWVIQRLNTPPDFDAIVGNPPFIRYQYLDSAQQERAELLIRRLGLRFTKHTNSWVPFVVGALNRLRPGGRLGMVVPAELLHVLHADSARKYLLDQCSRILVLDPEELWFENTLQGVVLLLAEKRASSDRVSLSQLSITRIRGRQFLTGDPEDHFSQAEYVAGEELPSKWTFALLSSRERRILEFVRSAEGVRPFSEAASVQVGIVTGANSFFLVPDDVVDSFNLGNYAHPMFGRSDHVAGVIYDSLSHEENRRRGVPTNFLWFDGVTRDQLGDGAARYIALGEAQGLHERFKCRIRSPWYSVPSVFSTSIGMLKRSHDYPRLVLNSARAYTTDTAYRIEPRNIDARQLVYSFVNSVTALTAELEGRHYGGGVLELVPSEINRLLLPLPCGISVRLDELNLACRAGAAAIDILDRQDQNLLTGIGLSVSEISEIQSAWWKLKSRRQRGSLDAELQAPSNASPLVATSYA